MNSNQQNEVDLQKNNLGFGQSHLRMQTEPSSHQLQQQTGNTNDVANNLYHMTFNSNKYRKEQQPQQSQQPLQQQSQLNSNQFNFTGYNQTIPKQQIQNTTSGNILTVNNTGVSQNLQQNYIPSLQQQQSSHNISSTLNTQQNQQANSSSNSNTNTNSQKTSSRVRSNHSYISGSQLPNQIDNSLSQPSSRFFQPAYDLFFEIQSKLDKDLVEKLKKQIPLDDKREKILKYESGNIMSFIKIIFENVLSQNAELKVQIIELQNVHKMTSASLSTTHHNTTNQSNGNVISDENSVEIACRYCKEYEQQLQKLEAEIRQHIRAQYLLKQSVENNQSKIEEVERDSSKVTDKLIQITKDYEDIKRKLEEKSKEIQFTSSQKQQLEKQIEQLTEKNKLLEQKMVSGRQSTSNLHINMSTLPSQQHSSHQSFMKTKSLVNNKHILDSFVDDGLLHEVDKSSSSKANFSSLSTAQQLQKSQELQKHLIQNDSQKTLFTQNNCIQGKQLFGNEAFTFDENGIRKASQQQNGDNSTKINQDLSSNGLKCDEKSTNGEFIQNENDISAFQQQQEKKNEKQSEELMNIQKKLKKLQKISEKKLQNPSHSISQTNQNQMQPNSSDLSLQKQLTERAGSIDKYQKPYQLQPNTQRINTISNLVGNSKEALGNKQTEERNALNSSNQNLKLQNSSFNTLKNQSLQYQQLQQTLQGTNIQNLSQVASSQNVSNIYGTIRNVQQINRPSSTLGQREITNISNSSLNISKISNQNNGQQLQQNLSNPLQQQINQNQQSQRQLNKSNSNLHQHTNSVSNNTERYLQNSSRTKIPKHNNNGQQFIGNNTINISSNQTSSHSHNLSHHNLNSSVSNTSIVSQQQQQMLKQTNVASIAKQSTISQKQIDNNQNLNKTQNSSGTININNYVNPQNNQKAQSPQKVFTGRQHFSSTNNCDTDRERNSSNGRQNSTGVYQQAIQNNQQNVQKTQNNQKSYEKLRAFMNSPKFKTDDEIQNNTRSQSMDGQSSYRNINQASTVRSKNNVPLQNYTKTNQKLQNQSSSNHYQINLSMNNNPNHSQLNSSIHNRSHF